MKLVEILARELEMWPEGALVLSQLENGYICKPGESSFDEPITVAYYDLAEDWSSAVVTRPQWQAERDRMKAMEKEHIKTLHAQGFMNGEEFIEAWTKATANAKPMPLEQIPEPTYEQQLWDRVAERAFFRMVDLEIETSQGMTKESISKFSADQADAFMAERAKRVGK